MRKLLIVGVAAAAVAITSACGGGGAGGSPSAQSASYQAGYQFGLTVAHPNLVVEDQVCGTAFIYASVPDKSDYVRGCTAGIHAPR